MKNTDCFSACHPAVNFLYFSLVLFCSMCWMHPVCLGISLLGAVTYACSLRGWAAVFRSFRLLLPMVLLAAILNPAFNHEGVTILTYLPGGNPLTLESIVYGLAFAGMMTDVILWFSCYHVVMTSDKLIYLFGRVLPALSLLLSMTLRFVPKFKAQFHAVSEAQRCIGRDISNGAVRQRLKNAIVILSIMVTWSLENAIETADSMKSRGYGLPGRTAFSIYRFDHRDKAMLGWLCFCGCYMLVGWMAGGMDWQYYPRIKGTWNGAFSVSVWLVYLLLCLTPVILKGMSDRKWKHLQYET